jgi:ACS family glucarate transporter-like MFS transporter
MDNHSTEEQEIPQCATQPDDPYEPDTRRVISQNHWRQIIENRDVWTLTFSNFFEGYIVYIYFFWFYSYLVDVRGFSLLRGSLFGTLPFVAMGFSAPLGGWSSDRLIPLVGKTRARRLVAMGGLAGAALLILAGARAETAYGAIGCLGSAAGSLYMSIGCYWATATENVPSHSATVTAIMNTGAIWGAQSRQF